MCVYVLYVLYVFYTYNIVYSTLINDKACNIAS